MKLVTVNASDLGGGAAKIAYSLYKSAASMGWESSMYVGKKTTLDNNVIKITRSTVRHVFAKLMSNDIDYYNTNILLDDMTFMAGDVYHFHNINGWYFNLGTMTALSRIKKVIWTLHDMWALTPMCGHSESTEMINGLFKCSSRKNYPTSIWNNDLYLSNRKSALYRSANLTIVVPSRVLYEQVSKVEPLKSARLEIIQNGTSVPMKTGRVDPVSADTEHIPTILLVASGGSRNVYKGYDDFERVARSAYGRGKRFLVIGEMVERKIHNNLWTKRYTTDAELSNIYHQADILLLPSKHEVAPLVVLEALAHGVSVIAYDVGNVSEVINNLPTCKIIKKGDWLAMGQAIDDQLHQRRSLGLANIKNILIRHIEMTHSEKKMISDYITLYKELSR